MMVSVGRRHRDAKCHAWMRTASWIDPKTLQVSHKYCEGLNLGQNSIGTFRCCRGKRCQRCCRWLYSSAVLFPPRVSPIITWRGAIITQTKCTAAWDDDLQWCCFFYKDAKSICRVNNEKMKIKSSELAEINIWNFNRCYELVQLNKHMSTFIHVLNASVDYVSWILAMSR